MFIMGSYYTYILYSQQLDKFYIGATSLQMSERLERHLRSYYGKSKFTSHTDDWILYFEIACKSFSQAQKIERHIKRMKSKTYIRNLKKYPEISIKLLDKYRD
jgi:putative endonuclease